MLAMEGQLGKCGEIRRLHIIYFLTHLGRSEHPHLIRVHHLTRTGVYLRDVKRWLGDLRGKDMAEAYAWSYKRRYKSGYVWQDLVDEDLITPLSDNEYVLKGSEIISTPVDGEKTDIINASSYHYCTENKAVKTTIMRVEDDVKAAHKQISSCKNSCSPKISPQPTATTTKTFSEINEDSSLSSFCSEKSSLTDELDSVKQENDNYQLSICNIKQDHNQEQHSTTTKKLEISTPLFNNNKVKRSKNNNELDDSMRAAGSSSFSSPSSSSKSVPLSAKRKSFSGGASNVLKSFITCRAVDTNDTVLVTVKHHGGCSGGFQKSTGSVKGNTKPNNNNNNEKDDQYVFTGGRRSFHTCWKYQEFEVQQPQNYNARRSCDERSSTTASSSKKDQQQSEFSKQRTIPSAYRAAREPNCSQCGKAFKPEKLHSHMKSCRGMKTLGNKSNANTSVNKSTVLYSHQGSSATSSYKESALAHFLTSSS
ncbi:protein SOSEKI 1 isoform X1 [Cannabis sativa]|uniref:protein SOSEKI 1 isoform X1 n=2 Tax=Cannabis sativa TaxID=3483 RepID=UPI0029CA277E|nr:protein SOSEKI 1 isoform X1 [Cannabis sativa]